VRKSQNSISTILSARVSRFVAKHLIPCSVSFLIFCLTLAAVSGSRLSVVYAQVEPPDRKFLFVEDRAKKRTDRVKDRSRQDKFKSVKREAIKDLPFDIDSPKLNFDSNKNVVTADGGLRISAGNSMLEAQSGEVNLTTKQGKLKGDVWFSDPISSFTADQADLNLETKTGALTNTRIELADGEYILEGASAQKTGEEDYELINGSLTTCQCEDGSETVPWKISGSRTKVQREGYGQVWDAIFRVRNVPVFYCPYVIFPVKTERQSGLLPASFGSGNEGGFHLELPFFWAINDSTDATITPLMDTSTRYGFDSEFRKIFSARHKLEAGFTYLNESARDGELQGTDISELADPTLDTNRLAGFWKQRWKNESAEVPVQMILDGRYVSDDLLLREFEIPRIGPFNSRYVTSKALLRTSLFENYSLEAASEFNQSLITSDDFVFQRLPEFTVDGVHRFRPFGRNPYGLRLVYDNNLSATNFTRKSFFDEVRQEEYDSYDGWRVQAFQQVKMPFRYQNYFDAEPSMGLRLTRYELSDTDLVDNAGVPVLDPLTGLVDELPSGSDRVIPDLGFRLRTTVERVYELEENSLIKQLVELGKTGTESSLVRLKHTLTPDVRYKLVPQVDQSDNPQFDSEDKLAQRNVLTYGLTQRLFGRFEDRKTTIAGIEELAPEASGLLPTTDTGGMDNYDSLDSEFSLTPENNDISNRGAVRELATFKLLQSFDVLENSKDRDPDRGAFSDVGLDLTLLPNEFIRLRGRSEFDVDKRNFSAYSFETQLLDSRGDQWRNRLTFNDQNVRQLETSLEIRVTDRLKLGYYARYDDLAGQFIENRAGIRISSSCNNCWILDVGISDKTNPNETKFLVSATLAGLGDLGNTFLTKNRRRPAT